MSRRAYALIAASFVALFYGANYTIAKDVMPTYVQPFGFIILRIAGALLLFWIISFLGPKEKIERRDYPRMIAAAIFGVGINMLAFFEGLSLTTPINASVLMVTTPMIVLILSVVFLKEKLKLLKVLGILIGLSGTLLIILYSHPAAVDAPNIPLGNIYIFINATSYSCYLLIVKKITEKYHPFTFMKVLYAIGLVFVLPFGYEQLLAVEFSSIPLEIYLKIGYVLVFATFGTYILNIFAIRELKPTTVAVFVYVQPFLAAIFAVFLGKDQIDMVKILAAVLIFTGVYLTSKKPKRLA